MTSSQHAPYTLGYTRNTMVETIGSEPVRGSESGKLNPSSDCRLQLAYMKLESLVIADQLCSGEYVPQVCTHRPSKVESRSNPKWLTLTLRGRGSSRLGLWLILSRNKVCLLEGGHGSPPFFQVPIELWFLNEKRVVMHSMTRCNFSCIQLSLFYQTFIFLQKKKSKRIKVWFFLFKCYNL